MEGICGMVSKAALALLIMNGLMLFVVEAGSAEQTITLLSIGMMLTVFVVSTALLRKCIKKKCKKGNRKVKGEEK